MASNECSAQTERTDDDEESLSQAMKDEEVIAKDEKRPISSSLITVTESENSKQSTSESESTEVFNETECMKFAEKLYKIIEELKINRVGQKENELRIQKLMSANSDLERLKEDEIAKRNELIQKCNFKKQEIKKQCDEKLQLFQEDKAKHLLENQSGEKEIKALKDEIRTLHITKYGMEKLIKDQERQIQSHGTTTTAYLTQLAKLEKQCKDVFQQCSQTITAVDKVEVNVNTSSKLQKKLTYINAHQNCVLKSYKEQLEKAKQDLITREARYASFSSMENSSKGSPSLVHLENELRMQKELCQQVQVQLNDMRQENQELLKSLNNAHELLGRHIETNTKYAETKTAMQMAIDELRVECEQLKNDLKTQTCSAKEKDVQLNEAKTTQKEKEKEFCEKLDKMVVEKNSLRKEKDELDSIWLQKNNGLVEEQKKVKENIKELEDLMAIARQEKEEQAVKIKRLEDDVQKQVTYNKDLLHKSTEDSSEKLNEITKWKNQAEELLENEKKLKIELDKMRRKQYEEKHINHQNTQTEKPETEEKETSTIMNDPATQPLVLQSNKQGLKTKEPQPQVTNVTSSQERVSGNLDEQTNTTEQKTEMDKILNDIKAGQSSTVGDYSGSNVVKNDLIIINDKHPTSNKDGTQLRNGCNKRSTEETTAENKKRQLAEQEMSPAKKLCLDTILNQASEPIASSENSINSENKKDRLPRSQGIEKQPIFTKYITKKRTTLLAVVRPALSSQREFEKQNVSGTLTKSNDSFTRNKFESKENTFIPPYKLASPTRQVVLPHTLSTNVPNEGTSTESNFTNQVTGTIVRTPPQEQKASSNSLKREIEDLRHLSFSAAKTSSQLSPRSTQPKISNILVTGDTTADLISTDENSNVDTIQSQLHANKPFSGNTTSENIALTVNNPSLPVLPEYPGQPNMPIPVNEASNKEVLINQVTAAANTLTDVSQIAEQPRTIQPQIPGKLLGDKMTVNKENQTTYSSPKTENPRKIIEEVPHTASDQAISASIHTTLTTSISNQQPCRVIQASSVQPKLNVNPLHEKTPPKKSDDGIANQTPQELASKGSTETKTTDNTLSSQPVALNQVPKNHARNVTKIMDENKECNEGEGDKNASGVEDFCFSDEEEESIPRAIGSQIDRIEAFLKSDRLRLNKKRKATHE